MNSSDADLKNAVMHAQSEKAHSDLSRSVNALLRQHVIYSVTDENGKIIDISDAFSRHTGYTRSELIGNRHNILRSESTPTSLYRSLWATINRGETWFGEVQNLKKDGTPFWIDCTITPLFDNERRQRGFLAIYSNITREKEIEEASYIDELTQVHNRKKLNRCLDAHFEMENRNRISAALVMIDIDHFKLINDTYGHLIGDEILVALSSFIDRQVRKSDLFCRWGGEEFVLFLPYITREEVLSLCEKLRTSIASMPCKTLQKHAGIDQHITCSFGVTMLRDRDTQESITTRADQALYRAKENGRNKVEFI